MTNRSLLFYKKKSEYTIVTYISGANGTPSKPWNDIFYDFFRMKYAANVPDKSYLDVQNQPKTTKETYHVYCERGTSNEDMEPGKGTNQVIENFIFKCYVRRKGVSEFFPHLQNLVDEVRRIFIREYESHEIAGIQKFDHFRSFPVIPPETPLNPFEDTLMIPCQITAFYWVHTLLTPTVSSYQGGRFSAGSFRLLDEFKPY